MIPFLPDPAPMMAAIFAFLRAMDLPDDLECDHICYRVASRDRYDELKAALSAHGDLAAETPVNGRPICIFKLHVPYAFDGRRIGCLELPAPKPGSDYAEGWEHAEFVTGAPLGEFLARHADIDFDLRAARKNLNPEISLRVMPRFQVKFHPTSILDVIAVERGH